MKVVKKQTLSHDCIVCGLDNPEGIKARFYEMEDGSLISLFSFKSCHQSYPERTHGGMITAMIDETIGRAIWIKKPGAWGCTIKLSIEYHKGVPYDVPLKCIGVIDSISSLTFKGHAEIRTMDNVLLARGEALYMFLPLDTIAPHSHLSPDDVNVPCPEDDNVTEID